MKILFYVMALVAGTFGLIAIFRATQSSLEGGGFDSIQFIVGIVGVFLAVLWVMRARSAK